MMVSASHRLAGVAQLVEQLIRNQQVTSSSLVAGSIFPCSILVNPFAASSISCVTATHAVSRTRMRSQTIAASLHSRQCRPEIICWGSTPCASLRTALPILQHIFRAQRTGRWQGQCSWAWEQNRPSSSGSSTPGFAKALLKSRWTPQAKHRKRWVSASPCLMRTFGITAALATSADRMSRSSSMSSRASDIGLWRMPNCRRRSLSLRSSTSSALPGVKSSSSSWHRFLKGPQATTARRRPHPSPFRRPANSFW